MNNNNDITLSTTVTQQAVAFGSTVNGFNVMATLKAPQFKASSRSPVDMICVVDRSGSMGGEKMALVKTTIEFVIQNLTEVDRLSIVAYDDRMEVPLELEYMNEHGKNKAKSAIASIDARGGTNLCGGLLTGIDLMRNRKFSNKVSSVLLFTDGQANEGYTQLADITRSMTDKKFAENSSKGSSLPYQQPVFSAFAYPMQQQQMQQPQFPQQAPFQQMSNNNYSPNFLPPPSPSNFPTNLAPFQSPINPPEVEKQTVYDALPCTVYTFGFGSDHDPNLLKGIAEKGAGIYYFIEKTSNISEAFADCLGGLLSVVGQNITLNFESLFDVKIEKVWTKFRTEVVTANSEYNITIPDIQSDEQRDILLSVTVPKTSGPIDQFELVRVTLKYQNTISDNKEITSTASAIIARPATAVDQKPNFELDKQHNRLLAAEAMEKATNAGNIGNLEEGRKLLENAISIIKSSVSSSDVFCKSLITDLNLCANKLRDRTTYLNEGQHMMNNNYMAHYQQRSSNVQMSGQAAYQTTSRSMQHANFNNM